MGLMSFYRNHPKRGVFFHSTFGWTFALKKGMFNLNENNRFVMSRNPMDLRKGVDSLCGTVRSCAPDPLNGEVYVSSNRSRTVLKLLHWGAWRIHVILQAPVRGPFPSGDIPARGRRLPFHAPGRACPSDGRHLPRSSPPEKILGDSLPGGSVVRKVEKKVPPNLGIPP